jgi:hypothetical protein
MMTEHATAGQELARGTGRLLVHVVAIVVGLVLMIGGVALGVTVVALPAGIPVGLAGLGIFLWGMAGRSPEKKVPVQPPPAP